MSILLVLTNSQGAPSLIHWADRLSKERNQKLTIICCYETEADPQIAAETASDPSATTTEKAVREIISSQYEDSIDVHSIHHPYLKETLLEKVRALDGNFVILGMQGTDTSRRLARQLFDVPDFDTMLLEPGTSEDTLSNRILIPMAGTFVASALRLALEIADPESIVTPFLVSPQFGVDSRAIARQELKRNLDALNIPASKNITLQVGIAGEAAEGIARAAADCQLVILGSKDPDNLTEIRQLIEKNSYTTKGAVPAIGLIRPKTLTDERIWNRLVKQIRKPFPRLGPTERINLFDRLQPGVGINTDFLIMMGLSTSIAALGLLSNSTAVVIGAMVVAPLMTPLIGAGFGLVQGNSRLFGKSMKTMVMGVLTGLLFAVVIGLLVPTDYLTIELITRSKPDLLDFAVAFLSGVAAAYAFARPGLAGTLAGVAIAAALVPPLATVGIALTRGVTYVAIGAAILHVTNLVAITLGAALIFYLLGVHGTRNQIAPIAWTRRAMILLVLASLCLVSFLGYKTPLKNIRGQIRPRVFPVSNVVFQTVKDRIDKEPGMQLLIASRAGFIEKHNEVNFLLSSEKPVGPEIRRELRQMLKELLGAETKVRIYIVQSAALKKE